MATIHELHEIGKGVWIPQDVPKRDTGTWLRIRLGVRGLAILRACEMRRRGEGNQDLLAHLRHQGLQCVVQPSVWRCKGGPRKRPRLLSSRHQSSHPFRDLLISEVRATASINPRERTQEEPCASDFACDVVLEATRIEE